LNAIRRGTEIYVEVEIRDTTTSPTSLMDPDGGVFFTLKDPLGVDVLTLAPMTKKSTGVYIYRYQTVGASLLGVWSMEFKAVQGVANHFSRIMGAFELVAD